MYIPNFSGILTAGLALTGGLLKRKSFATALDRRLRVRIMRLCELVRRVTPLPSIQFSSDSLLRA
jgi:hypothetical protein